MTVRRGVPADQLPAQLQIELGLKGHKAKRSNQRTTPRRSRVGAGNVGDVRCHQCGAELHGDKAVNEHCAALGHHRFDCVYEQREVDQAALAEAAAEVMRAHRRG